jgi:hypothetical protein
MVGAGLISVFYNRTPKVYFNTITTRQLLIIAVRYMGAAASRCPTHPGAGAGNNGLARVGDGLNQPTD